MLLVAFPCGVSLLGELLWAKLGVWIRARRAGSCGVDGFGVLGEGTARRAVGAQGKLWQELSPSLQLEEPPGPHPWLHQIFGTQGCSAPGHGS